MEHREFALLSHKLSAVKRVYPPPPHPITLHSKHAHSVEIGGASKTTAKGMLLFVASLGCAYSIGVGEHYCGTRGAETQPEPELEDASHQLSVLLAVVVKLHHDAARVCNMASVCTTSSDWISAAPGHRESA